MRSDEGVACASKRMRYESRLLLRFNEGKAPFDSFGVSATSARYAREIPPPSAFGMTAFQPSQFERRVADEGRADNRVCHRILMRSFVQINVIPNTPCNREDADMIVCATLFQRPFRTH